MLNVEKIKAETYKEIQKIAEDNERIYRERISEEFPSYVSEAKKSLWCEIGVLHKKYKELEDAGRVNALEWIYISFLRTGLLDGSPCYRIDFYDAEGYVSEIECAGSWDFHYVFDFYYRAKQPIMDRLKCQTRLKTYEINDILQSLSASFRDLSDTLIAQLIRSMSSDFAGIASKDHMLKIMLGDYMDQAELIEEVDYV